MTISGSIGEGWKFFKDSILFMFKKPLFLVPIFLSWIVFVIAVLYSRYYFPEIEGFWMTILFVYILIVIVTFTITFANLVMLELMEQIERGQKTSLVKAFLSTIFYNLIKVIPIALVWGVIWLFLLILKVIISAVKKDKSAEPSVEDAAQTLSSMNSSFSFWKLGINLIEKLVRMSVFLSLPAIAWENKGPFSALKKSLEIIRRHPAQFLTTYALTLAAGLVMAIPLIPISIMLELDITIPTAVWIGVIIYSGITWTLEIYLEQMSVGMLYLWHLKWLKNGGKGKLTSVKKPSLVDGVYELK